MDSRRDMTLCHFLKFNKFLVTPELGPSCNLFLRQDERLGHLQIFTNAKL